MNAQVELFADGEIELRWGTGFMAGQSMAAGVQSDSEEVYAPVTTAGGATFSNGVTSSWPGNDGVAFFCGTIPTAAPTSPQPTVSAQPTLSTSPTLLPTLAPTEFSPTLTQAPTPLPSPAPTEPFEPSYSPTVSPTYDPTLAPPCLQSPLFGTFESIANEIGVVTLELSSVDDGTEEVALPFTFAWFGSILRSVLVSSNGQINMDDNPDDNCCDADPISRSSDYQGDAISVAQEDLNPEQGGSIFFLNKTSSVVISFEGIPFFFQSGEVNAQVELFESGGFELRWGTGFLAENQIAAGVYSPSYDVYTPVSVVGSFEEGITAAWPGNLGVVFECEF